MDDREQLRHAEPRIGTRRFQSEQAHYRAAGPTAQSCSTIAEHARCVLATVSKLPRRMQRSRFDPQERIPDG